MRSKVETEVCWEDQHEDLSSGGFQTENHLSRGAVDAGILAKEMLDGFLNVYDPVLACVFLFLADYGLSVGEHHAQVIRDPEEGGRTSKVELWEDIKVQVVDVPVCRAAIYEVYWEFLVRETTRVEGVVGGD